MNGRNFIYAITGLLAGALAAFIIVSGAQTPMTPQGTTVQTGKALIGGPFSLKDQTGKPVTEKDFLGKSMLVFFGFTHCPDICPSALQVMSAALDKLGPKGAKVTPVFISFDSARDTPDKLAEYVKSFHPRLVGLTGTPAEIDAVAKSYHVFYQKVANDKSPDSYTYDHAAILYLMGPDGAFVTHIPHTTKVDEVVAVLDKALP